MFQRPLAVAVLLACLCIPQAAANLLGDPGFELRDGSWQAASAGTNGWWNLNSSVNAHAGNRHQYLGRGSDHASVANLVDAVLYQNVVLPPGANDVSLAFWLRISTEEAPGTAYDHLYVELRDTSDTLLQPLLHFSNLDATGGWVEPPPLAIVGFGGRTVRLAFRGTTDSSIETVFRLDDVRLESSPGSPLPDLRRDHDSISRTTVPTGGTLETSIRIANVPGTEGGADVGPFHVGYYWSTDPGFSGLGPFLERDIEGIIDGGTSTVDQRFVFNDIPQGTYFLGCRIDNRSEIPESNEDNNFHYWTVEVLGPSPAPDLLAVTGIPDLVEAGQAFDVTVTAGNTGAAGGHSSAINASVLYSDGTDDLDVSAVSAPWANSIVSYPPGSTIYSSVCSPLVSVDYLVEATDDTWETSEEHAMTLRVTPRKPGTLLVRARVTLHNGNTGCAYVNDTSVDGGVSSTDQQEWGVREFATSVFVSPDIRIEPARLTIQAGDLVAPAQIAQSPPSLALAARATSAQRDPLMTSGRRGPVADAKPGARKPRPGTLKPPRTRHGPEHLAGVITVKFRDGLRVRARGGRLTDFGTGDLTEATGVLGALSRARWERVDRISEERLAGLRAVAERNLGAAIADLNLQFHLRLPAGVDPGAMADALNALGIVELAQPVPRASVPAAPDFQPQQGYLSASPDGVGAIEATARFGTKGAGIRLADVEFGFNPDHLDLPSVTILGGPLQDLHRAHGTAVLGEIAAKDDGIGVRGIAPDCELIFSAVSSPDYDVGAAISATLDPGLLGRGDVLLIEQQLYGPRSEGQPPESQFGMVPVEWFKPYYDRIVLAVGLGVIVVEAAGNGSQNLDDPIYHDPPSTNGGHHPFLPQHDSGAILVGAGEPAGEAWTARARLGFSNFGATVDLQGWGHSIWTCSGVGGPLSHDPEGENEDYTGHFGGTSGASPFVAGTSVLLQAAFRDRTGDVLSPHDVRELLRSTGSPQQGDLSEPIGPMPDVVSAIESIVPTAHAGVLRIHNDGSDTLTVSGLELEQPEPWITWSAEVPLAIPPHSYRTVRVSVDMDRAPAGESLRRILVRSDDPDEDPYPDGIEIAVMKPPNTRPTVSEIADIGVDMGSTFALAFSIDDAESPASELVLTGVSSDQNLVPDANIQFLGAGTERTIQITCAAGQVGSATVNVTVRDLDGGSASESFLVTVTRPPIPPVISLTGDMAFGPVSLGARRQRAFFIHNDGAETLVVSGISLPDGFDGVFEGYIGGQSSALVTVSFTPDAVRAYGGLLTVDSNAANGSAMIAISGIGVAAPEVAGMDTFNAIPTIMITGHPGTSCRLLSSTNLVDWTLQSFHLIPPSGAVAVELPPADDTQRQFYRAAP